MLPNGLESIDRLAFSKSGLESVEFPSSLRKIAQVVFAECRNLKKVKFNDGLEVLGTDECVAGYIMYTGVFYKSALENIELPSTLKKIKSGAFSECKYLKSIKLPGCLEHIEIFAFAKSGL